MGTWQCRDWLHGAHPYLGTPLYRICRCQGAKHSEAKLAGPFGCAPRAPDPDTGDVPPIGADIASELESHAPSSTSEWSCQRSEPLRSA